ncbi:DNA (cytosine-5)-methyltransferase 1-like protein [Dinothrombium tinctorium]|uniref:Cytosine-specific methyltransferase n=1 Tax=Dinothrombium tinctorium TaxID=1965070 RepID=A0A3S3NSP0_9ACAR|nr:DNA (cytosine-5)-methyltransferase 1-like protein [Dinothrombium tinctorium]
MEAVSQRTKMDSTKRLKKSKDEQCFECGQLLASVDCNSFEFENAKSEFETLTSVELLSLYDNDNNDSCDLREFPTHKLTDYSLFDRNNHLVPIDSGLIENGTEIYVSGFVKPVYDDDENPDNGIATKDIGPINEWWIGGFDGGEKLLIGIESCSASYVLLKPSLRYAPYVSKILHKLYLSKYAIEFVSKNLDASYEELIEYIRQRSSDQYNEDSLLSNANFVIQQIMSFDEAGEEGDPMLLETKCIQDLKNFFGDQKLPKKSCESITVRTIARKDARRFSNSDTYATSTPLVREFFEFMFKEAIEKKENDGEKSNFSSLNKQRRSAKNNDSYRKAIWHEEATHKDLFSRTAYYRSVKIGNEEFKSGDFVVTNNHSEIGLIVFLMENQEKEKMAHIHWFCHGNDTILKETCDSRFIFMKYFCTNVSLLSFLRKVSVYLSNGSTLACESTADFICKKVYFPETAHFEDLPQELKPYDKNSYCLSCEFKEKVEVAAKIKLGSQIEVCDGIIKYSDFNWNSETFSVNDCICLLPESYDCESVLPKDEPIKFTEDYDETIYTEKYRKSLNDFIKGSMADVSSTVKVVQIKSIFVQDNDEDQIVQIEAIKFYRPENVFKKYEDAFECDLNELYLTDQTIIFNHLKIHSKCEVFFCKEKPKITKAIFHNWFYFSSFYTPHNEEIRDPSAIEVKDFRTLEEEKVETKRLKTMDLFAGCGGLAFGFEASGMCHTLWAVEKDDLAASSFQINFPKTTVFKEDANYLLKEIINGQKFSSQGKLLPQKGDIELLLAGPPCQGFSGINRFSSRQYSLFKNSLIVTLLSYIDYFRPPYVVVENVRNFVLFKNNMVLKLTLSCLLKMDYQVRVGVLQAGNFGLPQSRRRAIIIAASPHRKLPALPKPLHVFSQRLCQLSFVIDGKRYSSSRDCKTAYFRAVTVRDAIFDLPSVNDNLVDESLDYRSKPMCHYQRIMRYKDDQNVRNHICKQISALTQARINEIPRCPGADWRDLPNIRIRLHDGTIINKLHYKYNDVKNGRSTDGRLRGICSCASGEPCDAIQSRQENTLIPWCLVHTANRQYQWSGLYGRLQWNSFFPTIVTNPEPIGKQGRVIHPQENRIISVRECARSQSFPDCFSFVGGIMDCHRQIGNAVPPLLASAIANELKKSLN